MVVEAKEARISNFDPYGLRQLDFSRRVPESSEMFTDDETQNYIRGCDYPESVDDLLLALEAQELVGGASNLRTMRVLDAMCGPGRLGRELLDLGASSVTFHDGDERMTEHAGQQAAAVIQPGQSMDVVTSTVESIPLPDNAFDLIVCHNSTHQMSSMARLGMAIGEFARLTSPGGRIVIADYQRGNSPEFLSALEQRLQFTRPKIVPLLVPTFMAAFSMREFEDVARSLSGIKSWWVASAEPPILAPDQRQRVDRDPVKGHIMDYSPISLRVIIQK